jgi:hypothetical protein
MIYLQFEICRDTPRKTQTERGIAEFMFQSQDPASCTRRAVAAMGREGWRPIDLNDAREVVTIADFDGDEHLLDLARETAGREFAYELFVREPIGKAS